MKHIAYAAPLAALLATAAHATPGQDNWPDSHKLSDMKATIWTDPNGCQHWVIDDGVEGYMSPRLDKATGRPVCPGRQPAAPAQTITLGADALFDTDKAALRAEAVAELNDFGAKAKRLGKRRIFIQGHTDSRASDAYNLALSKRRARAVADYLQKNYGLVAQIEGRGEADPVASNATDEGRQANRRVEITVLD